MLNHTVHTAPTEEIRELASLYALEALSPDEAHDFEEHLTAGCTVCAEEVRSFRESLALIPFGVAAHEPPDHLRKELFARIQEPAKLPDMHVVRASEGDWKPMGFPGITFKRLYQESPGGNIAMLVRMEPGSAYPPHQHADFEHCYVLEGDLRFGDLVMHAGDYQCARVSTVHVTSSSENGCMILLVASQQNALLPWKR